MRSGVAPGWYEMTPLASTQGRLCTRVLRQRRHLIPARGRASRRAAPRERPGSAPGNQRQNCIAGQWPASYLDRGT
jgi:hypothetical protein